MLGRAHLAAGDLKAAGGALTQCHALAKDVLLKQEIAILEKQPNQNTRLKKLYSKLLDVLAARQDKEITDYYDRIIEVVDPDNPKLISLLSMIAERLERKDKPYDAMMIYRKIVTHNRKTHGTKSQQLKESLEEYARLLERTNDIEGAQKALTEAQNIH